jgi:hypothetical protein
MFFDVSRLIIQTFSGIKTKKYVDAEITFVRETFPEIIIQTINYTKVCTKSFLFKFQKFSKKQGFSLANFNGGRQLPVTP